MFGLAYFFFPYINTFDPNILNRIIVCTIAIVSGFVFALVYEKTNTIWIAVIIQVFYRSLFLCFDYYAWINISTVFIFAAGFIFIYELVILNDNSLLKYDYLKQEVNGCMMNKVKKYSVFTSLLLWTSILFFSFYFFSYIVTWVLFLLQLDVNHWYIFTTRLCDMAIVVSILLARRKTARENFFTFKPFKFYQLLKYLTFSFAITFITVTISALLNRVHINSVFAFIKEIGRIENYSCTMFLSSNLINTPVQYFLSRVIPIGILAPIFEEFFLRGIIYNDTKKLFNINIAITVSALLFGLAHIFPYSPNSSLIFKILRFIDTAFIGVLLAIAYEKTGNLLMPIFIHMTSNSFAEIFSSPILKFIILILSTIAALIILIIDLIQFIKKKKQKNAMIN